MSNKWSVGQTKEARNMKTLIGIIDSLWIAVFLATLVSGAICAPAVSADTGSVNDVTPLEGKVVFQTSSGGEIYIINADGTDLRYLTTGLDPALSPDGEWVAFARWGIDPGLYIINVDGTEERLLLGVQFPKAPAWSPDGTQIALTYQHGGQVTSWTKVMKRKMPGSDKKITMGFTMPADPFWKIGIVNVADSHFGELYCHDHSYSPSISPDGIVAYASDRGMSRTWIGIDEAATQDPNTYGITTNWEVDRSPVFSPDGTKIAFQYRSHDHSEIFVINPDGQGRTQLTKCPVLAKTPQSSVSPTWSPDGSQIAFLTDRTGKWEIWVMNADGSDPHPMFPEGTLDDLTFEYNNVDERVLSWQ